MLVAVSLGTPTSHGPQWTPSSFHALWFGSFPPEAGSTQALCGNGVLILQWRGSRPVLIFGGGGTPLEEIGPFSPAWASGSSSLVFGLLYESGRGSPA